MAVPIHKLRGVSYNLQTLLKARGLYNSDQLLAVTGTPVARKAVAEDIGVEPRIMLELANRADLARVRGIGGVFSDLLEHAGVDTVKELATRRPDYLYAKLLDINAQTKLAGRAPTQKAVEAWVTQAKELPKMLEN